MIIYTVVAVDQEGRFLHLDYSFRDMDEAYERVKELEETEEMFAKYPVKYEVRDGALK